MARKMQQFQGNGGLWPSHRKGGIYVIDITEPVGLGTLVNGQIRLPGCIGWVKALFVAVPQIEHNWTANGLGFLKPNKLLAR
jgi:hypothetical protein